MEQADMSNGNEHWRPVPNWEGLYEVSDLGRVRSLPRPTPRGVRGGRVLKGFMHTTGALRVVLCGGGVRREAFIYHLVAEAFLGPRPLGHEVRHLNDDRLDCRLPNLAYGTRSQNMVDSVVNRKHGHMRLTVELVQKIRAEYAAGESQSFLAEKYGVAQVTISAAITRRNWKHVA